LPVGGKVETGSEAVCAVSNQSAAILPFVVYACWMKQSPEQWLKHWKPDGELKAGTRDLASLETALTADEYPLI